MTGPVCDFCNEPTSTWRYPTRDFVLVLDGRPKPSRAVDLSGGWWCCDRCHPYVEAKQYDELSRHTYAKWAAEQVVPPGRDVARAVRATHGDMYGAFDRNRCGEPTRYVRRAAVS